MTGQSASSTHPLLPPTTEDSRVAWLRLLRSRRVGISTFFKLMRQHEDALSALAALPQIAAEAGVRDYSVFSESAAHKEMALARSLGAQMVCFGSSEYPDDLAQISDPPPFLWTIGDQAVLRRPMVALVGARNASSLGTRMTRALAGALSEQGYLVVSGLARGIDTAAHVASVEQGTLAVLAGGVDVMYPSENTRLAENIAKTGLRISEQPMGLQPQARHFPVRNRIISGISRAVVVVEAAAKSGSIITARCALDQGREVLAVPGHPFDARASGCNILIRDGARLVRNVDDIIEALPPVSALPRNEVQVELPFVQAPKQSSSTRSLKETSTLHQQILDRLGPSPLAEDQLIRDLAAPVKTVAPALVSLELDGQIQRQPGGLLSRSV